MKSALEIATQTIKSGAHAFVEPNGAEEHLLILAEAVVKLTEENEIITHRMNEAESRHQRYWEMQKDKEDIQRDRARLTEGIKEAERFAIHCRNCLNSANAISLDSKEWLSKYGEKKVTTSD